MSNEKKIEQLTFRLNKIAARPGAFKTPGVMRKIKRQIRNLENA